MRKIGLIALVLMLCVGGAVFAQSTIPTFCGTLSDADCAILTQAQDAQKSLDSVSFDMTANVTVTNVPNMDQPITVDITGNGSTSGMAILQSDTAALMQSDPGQILTTLLDKLDADLSLTVALPPALMQASRPQSAQQHHAANPAGQWRRLPQPRPASVAHQRAEPQGLVRA